MPDFDSFDAFHSDPREQALKVTLFIDGKEVTVPWKADGQAATTLRDRHDIEIGEVLSEIQTLGEDSLPEDVLEEHGIESRKGFAQLPDQERKEILEEVDLKGGKASDMVEAVAILLHAGFVRFEPSLTREEVLSAVGFQTLGKVPLEEMVSRLAPSSDETAPEANNETEGKG
jgi:hypothetical protein